MSRLSFFGWPETGRATQAKREFTFHEEEIALPQLLSTRRAVRIAQDAKTTSSLDSSEDPMLLRRTVMPKTGN
jgi:hypothetical protein